MACLRLPLFLFFDLAMIMAREDYCFSSGHHHAPREDRGVWMSKDSTAPQIDQQQRAHSHFAAVPYITCE
jgi:hypothetical protein